MNLSFKSKRNCPPPLSENKRFTLTILGKYVNSRAIEPRMPELLVDPKMLNKLNETRGTIN